MKFYSRCSRFFTISRSSLASLPSCLPQRNIVSIPVQQGRNLTKQTERFYTLERSPFFKSFHASSRDHKWFGSIFDSFKTLDMWYDLEKLEQEWDPSFSLAEFKKGATQALCTVTFLIQNKLWNDLRGLIKRPLIERLQQDSESLKKIDDTEGLTIDKIKVAVTRVTLQEIVDRKYCDIDTTFIIANEFEKQVSFVYTFRFHREYTEGKLPEWTIIKILIEDKNDSSLVHFI